MRTIDGDRLIEWLEDNEKRGRVLTLPDVRFIVGELAREYRDIAFGEPRLYTAEEMRHMPDRATVCVEKLISREDEERGYMTMTGWGVVWNRMGAEDGGTLIAGLLGYFFPNTIDEIPYRVLEKTENGKYRVRLYRFWTNRPTEEQSRAVKWENADGEGAVSG